MQIRALCDSLMSISAINVESNLAHREIKSKISIIYFSFKDERNPAVVLYWRTNLISPRTLSLPFAWIIRRRISMPSAACAAKKKLDAGVASRRVASAYNDYIINIQAKILRHSGGSLTVVELANQQWRPKMKTQQLRYKYRYLFCLRFSSWQRHLKASLGVI